MQNTKDLYQASVHSMLYILNRAGQDLDFHKIFKIMYFAEQKHLAKYGRMITEDSYIKMPNGPVPSYAYTVFQSLRANKEMFDYDSLFKIKGRYMVEGIGSFDSDELSETDIECLDESYEENAYLTFDELTEKSHDAPWHKAFDSINIYQMAKEGGATDEMIQYIKHINKLKKS